MLFRSARFEDPSGGPAIIVRHIHRASRRGYKFETPPVKGVEADRDYAVELRLLDPNNGNVIASYKKTFRTFIGQEVLPKQPLAVGPGHHPNPNIGSDKQQRR